jgi:CDP-4-dehydro-6-deoxyglucose reductase, E3
VPRVTFAGVSYAATPGEAVLDTLLRNGVAVSNSCRAGACQSCLLRASAGAIPPLAQRGLKATLVEQGYFLSCSCIPEGDLTIEPALGLELPAEIASLERLTTTVLRARLRLIEPLAYRAGQYITLKRSDGLSRSYSLASLPTDDTLELHVRLAPFGQMSGWLFNDARPGDALMLRGPAGDCFYTSGRIDQPLLFVATGTGLAPLAGIVRDALAHGHAAPIHLYHGSRTLDGFYFQHELADLSQRHANFHYEAVSAEADGIRTFDTLARTIADRHPVLTGWRGFVCGNPPAVSFLKKKMFLQGMNAREIFSDAFLEAPRGRT